MSESTLPQPDPALERLDRLVGPWSMEGHLVASDRPNRGADETANVPDDIGGHRLVEPDPSSWPASTQWRTELVQPVARMGGAP